MLKHHDILEGQEETYSCQDTVNQPAAKKLISAKR
jgi:hypothetical protein